MVATERSVTEPARFGVLLGLAPGNVPAYSSDYDTVDDNDMPTRESYRNYLDGMYMGYKWQCVEFARRWLYINYGYVFDDIAMAYDIFRLRSARVLHDNTLLPLKSFRNGCPRRPLPGCLLIWNEGGEFEETGHVAIITEVFDDRIRIAEQNYDHLPWPPGCNYARELRVTRETGEGYLIHCTDEGSEILGWVMQTDDDTQAEPVIDAVPLTLNLVEQQLNEQQATNEEWLDVSKPELAAYVEDMKGHRLSENDDDRLRYFWMSEAAEKELKHASNELHAMFMHATHHVLADDQRLARFNIPENLWAKLHQSWDNRRNQIITGRLDFSMSERGIKVYEYNADSASCHLECGTIQRRWAEHVGATEGWSPGDDFFDDLVLAWRECAIDGVVHIMRDNDSEEMYHALHMKAAIEKAGLECRMIVGVDELAWDQAGEVVDAEGKPIRWVWKTWAWETALEEIRQQLEDDSKSGAGANLHGRPRLADVLLRKGIVVFEPFWTAITSNKAILPVLWELFPNHPYLLESHYELSDSLKRDGYVAKPIGGRCGLNISVVDEQNTLVTETSGIFAAQSNIYQALFPLPKIGNYFVQHSSFTVDGRYSSSCVRVDPTMVITGESEILAVRVVPDSQLLDRQNKTINI